MCGILGFIGPRSFDSTVFGRALDVMQKRGPDDRGIYEEPEALLGHRRLAILDLSPLGHQPMSTPDGRYTITFNGEVYNYRTLREGLEAEGVNFRSHSDTEVILALYARQGPACLQAFRGMFAIAIWDRLEKALFLARDRMGIKPLYLWQETHGMAFASEIKALRALPGGPAKVDPNALAAYLAWGSVPEPKTIFAGVVALGPGQWALWRNGKLKTETFWAIPGGTPTVHRRGEALEILRPLLREAVGLRCISDAPLGAFLSGGVDSSSIVSLMRAAGQRDLRTFSISFPRTELDEGPFALKVAEEFGTDHSNIEVTESMVRNELDGFFEAMDQPTCDGVNTYLVSRFARTGGLTVSLSGLGGDELFAGYGTFRRIQMAAPWVSAMPHLGGWGLGQVASRLGGRLAKLEALSLHGRTVERLYYAARGHLMPRQISELLAPEVRASLSPNWSPLDPYGEQLDPRKAFSGNSNAGSSAARIPRLGERYSPEAERPRRDVVHETMDRELRAYMLNQLLRDSDVFGMAQSLEIRVPLLDHKLVEAVFQTNARLILERPAKSLLLDALPAPLPQICTHRPKMGFTFPFDAWMRGPWKSRLEEALMGNHRDQLNPESVKACWQAFLDGRTHWSRPWSLFAIRRQQACT